MPYKTIRARGITFVFKYDDVAQHLLHIYARHLKEPDDAIYIFFNGSTQWLASHELNETTLGAEAVRWFWLNPDKVVMIVSCFDI